MAWTAHHQATLDSYHAKFSLPPLNNDAARAWTRALAEQFAYSFAGEGWGHKQADPGRPPSTDCIAIASPFTGYDVIISQGAPDQALAKNPAPINLAGQVYIPVGPIDHLAGGGGGGAQDYPYPDEPTTGKAYQTRVKATYTEAGRAFPDPKDEDAFRHFMRYGYSTRSMPEPEASDKHIAELRADLGLPAAK